MEEGFFSNLMSDGNTSMSWDGISGLPEEDNSPPIIESISMPPVVEKTPTANARPNQKRSKNFNDKEDELLVSAWLNISTDAIYGTNQSRGTFWKRVYDYFHSNKEFESDRTQSSLLHRWGAIQENVNKFCGCVSQTEKRRQSRCTYQDKLVQAMALFKAQDKDNKSFQYMHCYNILRNQAKWHDKQKQMAAPQKQSTNKRQKVGTDATPATSTPNTANNTSNEDIENRPPEHDARKRPMGKKKAKELLRGGGTSACVEALDHLWAKKKESDTEREQRKEERYNQSYALEKERLQLEQKRAQIKENELQFKRMLEEERIMTMDITSMPPLQQQYYRNIQSEIVARRMNISG